jgi:integrase
MIVEQAMREKLIPDHVFKNLEVPESALEESEKAVIPPAVWSAFIKSARERDNMLFVYSTLMKGLGTRPSEARAMRWDCVNLTTGVVNVKWTVKHGKEGMANLKVTKENSIKRKKGHKRVKRMNNLLPHELEVLKLYKAEQTAELGKCDFLFMKDGDIVTKNYFSEQIREIQDELISNGKMDESERFVAYNIRHTVITDLLIAMGDQSAVAKLCGTSVEMIEKNYDHSDCTDAMAKKMRSLAQAESATA